MVCLRDGKIAKDEECHFEPERDDERGHGSTTGDCAINSLREVIADDLTSRYANSCEKSDRSARWIRSRNADLLMPSSSATSLAVVLRGTPK